MAALFSWVLMGLTTPLALQAKMDPECEIVTTQVGELNKFYSSQNPTYAQLRGRSIEELLIHFRKWKSRDVENAIFSKARRVLYIWASRLIKDPELADDAAQDALMQLPDFYHIYDPEAGTRFLNQVKGFITRKMIDYFRKFGPHSHAETENWKIYQSITQELLNHLNRFPNEDEITEALKARGHLPLKIKNIINQGTEAPRSFDVVQKAIGKGSFVAEDKVEIRDEVAHLMRLADDKGRALLQAYFFEGKKLKEIGKLETPPVSEGGISIRLSKLLGSLRAKAEQEIHEGVPK